MVRNETNLLPSVIDYALGNHDILRKIKYFSISDLTRYSDHCIIKLSVETKFKINTENAYPNLISAPPKFKWNNIYRNRLCEAFCSTECQTSLTNFYNSTFDTNQSDIDQVTSQLTNIVVHTTSQVVPSKVNFIKKKKAKKKWYDKSCFQLKHELNRLCNKVSKDPLNTSLRKAFINCRKSYKKILKQKERSHFMNLKDKLKTLGTNNPRQFWEIFKQLKNNHNDNANPTDFETWDEYFYNLYKSGNSVTNKNYQLDRDYNNNQAYAIGKILNKIITFQEVRKAIKKLKTGKSSGEDKILNECLRILEPCLALPITKL